MSAQAGLFYRDGRPINRADLGPFLPYLQRLGPDGGRDVLCGPVAMCYRGFWVTPGAEKEHQPLEQGTGAILTWDGRLDNRDDLITQLGNSVSSGSPDADIVSAAIARWGTDAFGRLLGDWAVASWDAPKRTIVLSRDYCGAAPLFYYLTSSICAWSSELEGLVEFARRQGDALDLFEDWIAGYFARGPEPDLTPYKAIRAIAPGSYLCVTANTIREVRHFAFDPGTSIRFGTDHEYEEQFRELLGAAVKCRLRTPGKVWIHLSGGLDSSSMVCVAADLVARADVATQGIETVSAIYDRSPEADERRFIRIVEEQCGFPSHHFSDSEYPTFSPAPYVYAPASPAYIDCYALRESAISSTMVSQGARVQISGEGGDELLGNTTSGEMILADLVSQGKWRQFCAEALRWSLATRQSVWKLLSSLCLDWAPDRLRAAIKNDDVTKFRSAVLSRNFARRMKIRERLTSGNDPYGFRVPSQMGRSSGLWSVIKRVSMNSFRRVGCAVPTYPYLDRRLVTFLLSIPAEQLARPNERRSLQRRALASTLPIEVLNRRSKRSPDASLSRGLIEHWDAFESLCRNQWLPSSATRTSPR